MQDLGKERCGFCTSAAHASTRGRPSLPLPGAAAAVRPPRLHRVDLREGIDVRETWRSCVEEMEMWAPSTRKVGQGGPARADGEDFFLEGAVDSAGLFRGAKSQPKMLNYT
jgi:hypothetical protein